MHRLCVILISVAALSALLPAPPKAVKPIDIDLVQAKRTPSKKPPPRPDYNGFPFPFPKGSS